MTFAVVGALFDVHGRAAPGRVVYRLDGKLYATERAKAIPPVNFAALIGSAETVPMANAQLDRCGWPPLRPIAPEDVRSFLIPPPETPVIPEKPENQAGYRIVAAVVIAGNIRFIVAGDDGACFSTHWVGSPPSDPTTRLCQILVAANNRADLDDRLRREGCLPLTEVDGRQEAWQRRLYGRVEEPALVTGYRLAARCLLFQLDQARHSVACQKYFEGRDSMLQVKSLQGTDVTCATEEAALGLLLTWARDYIERGVMKEFRYLELHDFTLIYGSAELRAGVTCAELEGNRISLAPAAERGGAAGT